MEKDDDDPCVDEENQSAKRQLVMKMNGKEKDSTVDMECNEIQDVMTSMLNDVEEKIGPTQQGRKITVPTSYKSMLLSINGVENNDSSGDMNMWDIEEDSEKEMQEDDRETLDPLCPHVSIMTEERKNLCRPWRKTIIIKLLGRRIGYRFMYGRLAKLWSLSGNFNLINLENDFFVVRFAEMVHYEQVLYDGPWMILAHYLTIQRWKP